MKPNLQPSAPAEVNSCGPLKGIQTGPIPATFAARLATLGCRTGQAHFNASTIDICWYPLEDTWIGGQQNPKIILGTLESCKITALSALMDITNHPSYFWNLKFFINPNIDRDVASGHFSILNSGDRRSPNLTIWSPSSLLVIAFLGLNN